MPENKDQWETAITEGVAKLIKDYQEHDEVLTGAMVAIVQLGVLVTQMADEKGMQVPNSLRMLVDKTAPAVAKAEREN